MHLVESYENLTLILKRIDYQNHKWVMCGDLKVISLLLVQQRGYTKIERLCNWDRRNKYMHWIKKY